MAKQQDAGSDRVSEDLSAMRDAVEFLLGQEMARTENSVRWAPEHARARDLRRGLRRLADPGV
ncbi:MAG TPA: hypothetical protein VG370_23685 [Chloroflexota bacterium]|jgi:hypothetical protein|nr:hypothetical protein [Chloroflexota bacterium]